MTAKNNTDIADDIRDFKAGGGRLGGRSVAGLTDLLTTIIDSNTSRKNVYLNNVIAGPTSQTTGDGKLVFIVPAELDGMNLVDVKACVATAGVTGTCDVQLRNVTDSVDMLSTKITIDTTELSSETAATPAVIDATKDDVAEGDVIAVDIDAIHSGTAAKGLSLVLAFELPNE